MLSWKTQIARSISMGGDRMGGRGSVQFITYSWRRSSSLVVGEICSKVTVWRMTLGVTV